MFQLLLQPFKKCFDFQGRARRSEFWLIFLILSVLYAVFVYFILYPILEMSVQMVTSEKFINTLQDSMTIQNCQKLLTQLKQMVALLDTEQAAINELPEAIILSILASMVFATHFGVLSLFFYTFLLSLTIRRLHDSNRSAWWVLIMLLPVLGTIWFLILMCLGGSKGSNNYGPNPRKG